MSSIFWLRSISFRAFRHWIIASSHLASPELTGRGSAKQQTLLRETWFCWYSWKISAKLKNTHTSVHCSVSQGTQDFVFSSYPRIRSPKPFSEAQNYPVDLFFWYFWGVVLPDDFTEIRRHAMLMILNLRWLWDTRITVSVGRIWEFPI